MNNIVFETALSQAVFIRINIYLYNAIGLIAVVALNF